MIHRIHIVGDVSSCEYCHGSNLTITNLMLNTEETQSYKDHPKLQTLQRLVEK